MENKSLEVIAGRVATILEQQNIKRQDEPIKTETTEGVLFVGEAICYCVIYNHENNCYELRSTSMTEEGPNDTEWKTISQWMYDLEEGTTRDYENIAEDFSNTLDTAKQRAAVRAAKRKVTKDEDNNPGPVFFFKRLVNIFPELRQEIAIENETYEDFRAVTFAKAKIVPLIDHTAAKNDPTVMKKLCNLLQDMYINGDMDVSSIITMVIFNGVSDNARANLLAGMDSEFQSYYKKVARYKNKKVKPEKPKKNARKRLSRSSSANKPERLSGDIPREYRK